MSREYIDYLRYFLCEIECSIESLEDINKLINDNLEHLINFHKKVYSDINDIYITQLENNNNIFNEKRKMIYNDNKENYNHFRYEYEKSNNLIIKCCNDLIYEYREQLILLIK